MLERAKQAGVLRNDFGIEDVGSVFGAMSTVVSNGGRAARDGLLKVILDGLRAR